MSKILEKCELGISVIMQKVYIYIPDKKNPENMLHRKDVTTMFKLLAFQLGYRKIPEPKTNNKVS